MERVHIRLTRAEREKLESIRKEKKVGRRAYQRATGLLALDRGKSLEEIAKMLGAHRVTVAAWRDDFMERGLACLKDRARSGRPHKFDGVERAKITALACSEAPEGHARWTLRMLADKAVELGYCDEISYTQVRTVLKKTNSNRTLKKRGASGK